MDKENTTIQQEQTRQDQTQQEQTQQDETRENTGNIVIETAKTDDFEMKYCRFGYGENILVILPGLSIQSVLISALAIEAAFEQFKKDYTIYLFERRNDLPQSYSVFDSARDAVKAFQTIGLEHFSLFGASYGGMIAMTIAAQNPAFVDKLVLAATSAKVDEEIFKTIGNWVSLAEKGNAKELYLAFGEALYPKEVFERSRGLLANAARTVTEEELKRFIILSEGIKGFDLTDRLDQIKCPVLAIGDKQDRVLGTAVTDTIACYMEQRSDFELYMYDGYGHAVYDMAPDFRERMMKFLK